MDFSKGVVFKVQIGAFKNKNLAKYFDNNPNFGGEAKDNEPQKLPSESSAIIGKLTHLKNICAKWALKMPGSYPIKMDNVSKLRMCLEGVVSEKPTKAPTDAK